MNFNCLIVRLKNRGLIDGWVVRFTSVTWTWNWHTHDYVCFVKTDSGVKDWWSVIKLVVSTYDCLQFTLTLQLWSLILFWKKNLIYRKQCFLTINENLKEISSIKSSKFFYFYSIFCHIREFIQSIFKVFLGFLICLTFTSSTLNLRL